MNESEITVLILAGGQSRRMGGHDKAFAIWRGQTLLDHAVANAFTVGGPVLISSNADPDRFAEAGLPVLPDPEGLVRTGPLAGILAALEAMASDRLLVLPVDTPTLPPDLAEQLSDSKSDLTIAAFKGRTQQVLGLWHRSLAGPLRRYLESGERKVMNFVEQAGEEAIEFDFDGVNLNTPEDLA